MHPVLSTHEVAERCGTTDEHIRRLARDQRIPHYRIGPRLLRFDPDEIDRWIADSRNAPREAVLA